MSTIPPASTIRPVGEQGGRDGVLQSYARLKLELAAVIRSAMQLAKRREDDAQVSDCRRLLTRLAEDRFNLAVVGQFNRGKTSLMNALLGLERLPTGVLPLTSVITTVCYGDRERVLVQQRGWSLPREVPLDALAQYVTEDGNPGNEKRVVHAEVQLPAEILRLGFFFIDTPGVGSSIAANTGTTREFLPEADAVIFVTSFEAPLGERELEFLEQVRRHVRKVFVVINKLDLVSAEQRDEAIAFVRETLSREFDGAAPRLFPVSAREGLHAKLGGREEPLGLSGLPQLENALVHFLRTEKARECLARIADRAAGLLRRQDLELRLSQRAGLDPGRATGLEQQFRHRMDELRREQEQIVDDVRSRLGSELPERVGRDLASWCREVETTLVREIREYLAEADFLAVAEGASDLVERVRVTCQERLSAWFTERRQDFERVAREVVGEEAGRLERLLFEMRRYGPEPVHAVGEGSGAPRELGELTDGIRLLVPEVPPCRWSFQAPWRFYLLPVGRTRRLVADRCAGSLDVSLSEYRNDIRSALRSAGREWADRLGLELAARATAAAARMEKVLRMGVSADDLAEIDRLRKSLERVQAAILELESGRGESDSAVRDRSMRQEPLRSDAAASCQVCTQVEGALFDFLSNRQYELTTSEGHQLGHVERGGFCALHTWQYAAVASPQGICLAYPPLLASFGRSLRALASRAPSSASLRDRVRELLPRPGRCEACRLVSVVETTAVRDLVSELSSGNGVDTRKLPALCVPHLSSILATEPDAELARLLIEQQAAVLERLAEDMQRYALKHDAVRRQLATEGEWHAYRSGLSHLVGERNVVAPWKVV